MTASRRICILAHSHPDISKGGGEVAAYREFQTLSAEGHAAVFVGASEVNTAYAGRHPMETVLEYAPDEYVYSFAGMAEDRLSWEDPFQRRALVEFLAGLDCEVYHFHHYWRVGLDLVAELMEARPDAVYVMTLHEMLAICLHHGQMIRTRGRELCNRESPLRCLGCYPDRTIEHMVLRKAYMLSVLRRFDQLIYPSDFIRRRYEAWGLPEGRGSVLENYLGDELAEAPRRAAEASQVATRFGFFGQPTAFKGLDVLIKAAALALRENPAVSVTVFGCERGDVERLFPDLKLAIEEAGQNLALVGRYDPKDVLDLMAGVGWIVVPSVWWENSPVVIQEARRAGTPLIVSDIGGMAEKVLEGVDGLQFHRGSPVDLARAMLEAARPEVRAQYGLTLRDVIGRAEFLAGLETAFRRPALPAAAQPAAVLP
jgi:glycosyltransferase involved in cell wall biosynthesis